MGHNSKTEKVSVVYRNYIHANRLIGKHRWSQVFLSSLSVITGVFTFVALSFYSGACMFNTVITKYLFFIGNTWK